MLAVCYDGEEVRRMKTLIAIFLVMVGLTLALWTYWIAVQLWWKYRDWKDERDFALIEKWRKEREERKKPWWEDL